MYYESLCTMEINVDEIEYFREIIMKNKTLNINNIISNRINIIWKKIVHLIYRGIGFFIRIHQYNRKYCDFSLIQIARIMRKGHFFYKLDYMKKKRQKNLYYQFFKDIYFLCFQFFLTLAIIANWIFYTYLLWYDKIK